MREVLCISTVVILLIVTQSYGFRKLKVIAPDTGFVITSHSGRAKYYESSFTPLVWLVKPTQKLEGYNYHVSCRRNFEVGTIRRNGICPDNKLIFKYGANERRVCGYHEKSFKVTIKSKYMLRIVFIRGNRTTGHKGFKCRVAYDSKYACPRLNHIMSGQTWHVGKIQVGSEVRYICKRGYELVGHDRFNCMENGKWNITRIPSCRRVTCPKLPALRNGIIMQNRMSVPGDIATVSCQKEYKLSGSATSQFHCRNDGSWSQEISTLSCQK